MAKPGLTLHRLRLFLAVLDHGGVARAATKENISQPTVSEHLRGLEEHFGVQLVDRVGRGVVPTASARQLEPYVRQVVQLLQSADQLAADLQGVRTGSLTIGASSTPGTYLLPHALGRFRAQYPGVALQLRIRNTAQVERWVASGEVELGVIGDATDLSNSFAADPWLEDELIVLVQEQHALARRGSAKLSALASAPIIAREEGSSTRRTTERCLGKHGLKLNPVMELGSTEAIREAVAAGLGIALVSKYAAGQHDPRVATARLDGAEWRRRFTVIRRANTSLGPAAIRFLKVLLGEHLPGEGGHKRRLSQGA
jgi:DNA-binding transcriptional LysR family regulator